MTQSKKPHWALEHATKVAIGVLVVGALAYFGATVSGLFSIAPTPYVALLGTSRLEVQDGQKRVLLDFYITNLWEQAVYVSPILDCRTNTFDPLELNVHGDFAVPPGKRSNIVYLSQPITNSRVLASLTCPMQIFDYQDVAFENYSLRVIIGKAIFIWGNA